MLLFPPFIWLVNKFVSGQFYNETKRYYSCRNYWLPTSLSHIGEIVVSVDFLHYYTTYITFFIVTFLFCLCSILILKNLQFARKETFEAKLPSVDVEKFQNFMRKLRSFRSVMSLPVFILFCQIALDAFLVVSLYASNASNSLGRYKYTTPQTTMWFLFIIYFADVIQAKSLQFVQVILREMETTNYLKRKLNYFDYKELKKCCSLTAWDMWIIDRKLLLKSFATLVTYGVIISELKT
ncbi:hypothetical protein HNY73_020834 [Argiope bruennichi]|uniref:Uncharacterized protein n=1 Tax=Argiope bruennichi TaxID=94029 RepID=A0A8T0ECT1_ARGBR|nr:hypothetical protein HNY73_020834 [Argiope bruennichi]